MHPMNNEACLLNSKDRYTHAYRLLVGSEGKRRYHWDCVIIVSLEYESQTPCLDQTLNSTPAYLYELQ